MAFTFTRDFTVVKEIETMSIMICEVRGAFRISLPAMLVRERGVALNDSLPDLHTSARDEEKRIVVTYHNGYRFVFI